VGTQRQPFWESIKEFKTSCGEVGWQAVDHIAPLLALFREKNLPVLYPYVAPKENFDLGRLADVSELVLGGAAASGGHCGCSAHAVTEWLSLALSAVVAAFCAVGEDAFEATVSALAVYGVAGEMAAELAQRPGSYRVAFMDMLDAINAADVAARLKVL
jgi:hypothetical protein